jgi:hypothetical protein
MQHLASRSTLVRRIFAEVAPVRGYERLLWWGGGLLLLSAAVHSLVWLASGEPWSGTVSWRKPILFGESFGVTLLSMAWILRHLPVARRTGWIVGVGLVASSLVEVGLITMQRWRGVASHFNFTTDFDSAVFGVMGFAVTVFATFTIVVLVWAARRAGVGSVRMAALGGVALLLVAQGFGSQLIAEGTATAVATGAAPAQVTIGAAGSGKLPHGIGIHALQVLAALAVVLEIGSRPLVARRRAMVAAIAGCTVTLAWAIAQTYLGRAPLDLTPVLALVLACGLGLIGGAYGWAAAGLSRPAAPDATPTTSGGPTVRATVRP